MILCSAERAEALGVPRDRWVFPHSGTDAHDHYFVVERDDLGASPAMRLGRPRAPSTLAGVGVDDLAHVDLYSCFPSAVQIAADELGLGTDRPLTVTGGLSLRRRAVEQLRDALDRHDGRACCATTPARSGLVTANGGFITKHAFGVYGTEPPADGVPARRRRRPRSTRSRAGCSCEDARRRGGHRDVDRHARPRRRAGDRASWSACSTTAAARGHHARTPTP